MHTQAALDHDRVAEAIAILSRRDGAPPPTVPELAAHVRLSTSQLHRLFARWAGTTPKRFLQFVTANGARDRLLDDASVLEATYASGLSSAGRLHDLMVTIDAMTPGEVGTHGAGLELRTGTHETPLGRVLVATTPRGICLLTFVDPTDPSSGDPSTVAARRWPRANVVHDPATTWAAIAPAFGGTAPVRLHVSGTNLQLKVWEALLRIPEGTTASYGQVAAAVGRPAAVRAVASAVGRNPVAYLIPCHRVIRSTGHLGGYAWGLDRKRLLLAREGLANAAAS